MLNILNIALLGLFSWTGASVDAFPTLQDVERLPSQSPVEAIVEVPSIKLTAYNAVPEQTDSTPNITASGAFSNPEVIVARSRDLAEEMPFGTIVELVAPRDDSSCGFEQVEHFIGYRVVADTMHSRKTQQIDVMFDIADSIQLGSRSVNPAIAMGICNVTVRIVGSIDINDIPDTQVELAILVHNTLAIK